MSDIDMNIDNKVHLFAIHDDTIDVFAYPFLSTFDDLESYFLSVGMECSSNVPVYFKFPAGHSLYDCGTYEPLLSDGSDSPYCNYPRPRFISRLTDFLRGDKDNGKSTSSDKNL